MSTREAAPSAPVANGKKNTISTYFSESAKKASNQEGDSDHSESDGPISSLKKPRPDAANAPSAAKGGQGKPVNLAYEARKGVAEWRNSNEKQQQKEMESGACASHPEDPSSQLSHPSQLSEPTHANSLVDQDFVQTRRLKARFMVAPSSPGSANWMGMVEIPFQAVCYALPGMEKEDGGVQEFTPLSMSAEDFWCTPTNHSKTTTSLYKENKEAWTRSLVAVTLPHRSLDPEKTHRIAYFVLVTIEPPKKEEKQKKGNSTPAKVSEAYNFFRKNMDDHSVALWFVHATK